MITSPLFINYVLPVCISVGLGGFLSLLVLSRLLYDHVQRHHANLMDATRSQSFWLDQDQSMAFIADIWTMTRDGSFHRVQSPFWRVLFGVNAVIGGLMVLAMLVVCIGFVS
ncbi:hypothetical protein SAMN02745857_03781 [Andreprevotia lacus DSM 23236]|jgi:hypothetical protein|uniref:Uncharacterized protein n=1 Tax=Andreprevotia lacus DSM 23236 TaxID=1121001 RepID=A0A1W1XZL4_9NEIS|nr:hypothetical protein [Andreprevotia lacus]SMC29353.1 hypothetical protein SAMN02745857_03781 [Andreprevotia lacus DSM 23236]